MIDVLLKHARPEIVVKRLIEAVKEQGEVWKHIMDAVFSKHSEKSFPLEACLSAGALRTCHVEQADPNDEQLDVVKRMLLPQYEMFRSSIPGISSWEVVKALSCAGTLDVLWH